MTHQHTRDTRELGGAGDVYIVAARSEKQLPSVLTASSLARACAVRADSASKVTQSPAPALPGAAHDPGFGLWCFRGRSPFPSDTGKKAYSIWALLV